MTFSKLSQDGAPCDSRHSNSCCKVRDDDIVVVIYIASIAFQG